MRPPLTDVDDLAARIPDGACIALAKDPFAPMAMVRALIARGSRGLHLVTAPTGGVAADALLGGGCVATVETSGISLGEFGPAPFFGQAVKDGTIILKDATCPAVYAALQAGEKGIPFIPIRGIIGSDILAARAGDWKVVANPFDEDDPIVVLRAIRPDVAVIHAALADRHGNVWVDGRHELKIMAHAARRTLATAERVVEGNLAEDPARAPNLISAHYVEAVAEAPGGAWPLAAPPAYGLDAEAVRAYAAAARQAVRGGGGRDWLETITPRRLEAAE